MSIQGLDVELLGERFAKVIEQYGRAGEARNEAAQAGRAALDALGTARGKDVQALAEAQLAGKTVTPTAEKKAQQALDDAKLRADVAARAEGIARSAVLSDVYDNLVEYEAVVGDAIDTAKNAALDVLSQLEGHMRRLQVLEAHQRWIQKPVKGEGTITGPRILHDEVGPAVAQVAQVVTGDGPPSTQAEWGIPAGIVPDDGYAYRLGGTQPTDADAHIVRDGKGAASVQQRLIEETLGA